MLIVGRYGKPYTIYIMDRTHAQLLIINICKQKNKAAELGGNFFKGGFF